MQHSETLGKIAPALVKALGEMEAVAKSAANPHFKSKFTPLDEVIETSRPILAANKLALMQFPAMVDGNKLGLETVIMHESGEWIAAMAEIFVSKPDPQQVGSAISYLRRYAQKAALNLADADDDAEGQMSRGELPNPPVRPIKEKQQVTKGQAPKPTLKDRSERLKGALRASKTQDELRKTYELGSGLCAELDAKDPEALFDVEVLYKELFDKLDPFNLEGDAVPAFD